MVVNMLQRNRHPSGRLGCMVFGLSQILDGLVRVLTFGFVHTTFPLMLSREQAKRHIARLKRERAAMGGG